MPEPTTYQEALDALAKIADSNGNRFRLKVLRRPNAATSITQHVATFGDATWQHIADAESWLSAFCGGGLYILQIFDGQDGRKQHGQITPSEVTGAPRPPDPRVCQSAAWTGPVLLSSAAGSNGFPGGGAGATATSPFTLVGEPSSLGIAPRTHADVVGLSNLFSAEKADLSRREEELREKERRAEVDVIRRESDARAKGLEQRLADLTLLLSKPPPPVALPPPPPPLDIPGLLTALGAIAGPIVAAVVSAGAEARKVQAELEKTRLEREEKMHLAEREERKLAASKPLLDPQILEIMDRQSKRSDETNAQFSRFLEAQAASTRANVEAQAVAQRTMLQTIAEVAQIQLKVGQGGEEPPGIDWMKVVQGVAGAFGAFAASKAGQGPGAAPTGALGTPPGQLAAAPPPAPEVPLPDVPASPLLDAIEDRVRKKDPPDQVMIDVKAALLDPGVKAEVEAEGGLLGVFEARLGDFAEDPSNAKYVEALQAAIESSGVLKAG